MHRRGEGRGASASLDSCNRWLAPPMHFCALVLAAACDEMLRIPQADGLQRRLDFRGWSAAIIEHVLGGLLRPHVLDSSEVSPRMLAHGACALAHLQAHAACVAPYDVRRWSCSTTLTGSAGLWLLAGPAFSSDEAGDGPMVTRSSAHCTPETDTIVDETGLEVTIPSKQVLADWHKRLSKLHRPRTRPRRERQAARVRSGTSSVHRVRPAAPPAWHRSD